MRNNQSFAHDNPILNYEEALLIFNHAAASVRFLRAIERRPHEVTPAEPDLTGDDIPF